jgi:hypothetical protein
MERLAAITALIAEVGVLLGAIRPLWKSIKRIANGQKSLLRSDMLQIYYHNRKDGIIRQYEYENFVCLFEAYKALGGNSFIDRIYKEVQSWQIVS